MNTRTFLAVVLALTAGCGSSQPGNSNNAQSSSISFALSGGDFSGNSVQICGNRDMAADGKYRCNNSLTSATDSGMPGCSCFNFDASGGLMDPNTGGPLVIDGLCPSNDFPNADWTFTYSIFSEQDCMGTQLNDGTHNLTCFDSHDLAAMANANESLEPLDPGENINHILCVTENASKQFNFESCAIATTAADTAAGDERFDCGCTPTGTGTCDCGPEGVGPGDLPDTCSFDLVSCNIVCQTVTADSCVNGTSQAVLVRGDDVVAYVPLSNWPVTTPTTPPGTTGVAVVNVGGSSITPTVISTPGPVYSCASNSMTGVTVCVGDDGMGGSNNAYVIEGTTLTHTLTTAAFGHVSTQGGQCSTCTVTMDQVNNRALIGLSVEGVGGAAGSSFGGYQFLDLATDTLGPAFILGDTLTGQAQAFLPNSSLIDPGRNLILSPTFPVGRYFITDISRPTAPVFFTPTSSAGLNTNYTGEDCSTGIFLADPKDSIPAQMFVGDLTQAMFMPGTPSFPLNQWSAPSQVQGLTESGVGLEGGLFTPAGIAVAQGTHTGVVAFEPNFGGAPVGPAQATAIALPATSGSGTPEIMDWVSCQIATGFNFGRAPTLINAYKDPSTGHAIATFVDFPATTLAVVDLTEMLDPAIVPRTSPPTGGHLCTSGVLPSSIVRLVPIP